MPRSRLVLAALLGACALAATAAPAASAAPKAPVPKEVAVDATFTFDYTTTWKEEAAPGGSNCAREQWSEGEGSETYELKSRRPVRMIFRLLGDAGSISAPLVDGKLARYLVSLSGPHTRRRTGRVWHTPTGPCEFTPYEERFKGDCGTRLPAFEVLFAWDGDELDARMGGDQTVPRHDRDQQVFRRCDMLYPQGSPGVSWWLRTQKLLPATVLGKPSFSVGDSQTWSHTAPAGARPYTGTSTLTWKATFTRVGKVKTTGETLPQATKKRAKKRQRGGKRKPRRRG